MEPVPPKPREAFRVSRGAADRGSDGARQSSYAGQGLAATRITRLGCLRRPALKGVSQCRVRWCWNEVCSLVRPVRRPSRLRRPASRPEPQRPDGVSFRVANSRSKSAAAGSKSTATATMQLPVPRCRTCATHSRAGFAPAAVRSMAFACVSAISPAAFASASRPRTAVALLAPAAIRRAVRSCNPAARRCNAAWSRAAAATFASTTLRAAAEPASAGP